MSVKVLLVEDEKSIADGIIYNLKNEGYKVTHVDDGKIAIDIFNEEHFDFNSYIIHTEYEFKSR